MTDLSKTITPKSDQLNADDLTTEPRTIRVTKVSANPGSSEQPISIYFEGDDNKPWKPCKSMRRVLVQVWGRDGAEYVGRRMTLFRDPSVQWGGVAVGGIRISHMSDIDQPMALMLTASRASRKPYTVDPLGPDSVPVSATQRRNRDRTFAERGDAYGKALTNAKTLTDLQKIRTDGTELMLDLARELPEVEKELRSLGLRRFTELGGKL